MRSTIRTFLVVALSAVAALTLAACGDDASSSDDAGATAPTVRNAWARTSAAGQTAGAAYMEIVGGGTEDVLRSASVPASVAGTVEVHETTASGAASSGSTGMGAMSGASGMMTMRPVDQIAIPADKTVILEPGGYHVMLLDLPKPLNTGDRFTVTLTFDKAGRIDVPVEVRAS